MSSDTKTETDGSSTECKDSSTNFDTSREAVPCPEPVALERLTGHQNIVELMDKFVYVDMKGNEWEAMALTLCGGGSLKEYRANTVVTEPMARYFFSQIMSAVLYMHLHGWHTWISDWRTVYSIIMDVCGFVTSAMQCPLVWTRNRSRL